MIIKTHDGQFHADEVFACAFIKMIFNTEPVNIIRNRNENITADLYIDVGGKFDNLNYYDHHFKEFNQYHDINKIIPKASFGLIWDKFSYKLNKNEKILKKIKNLIVIPIDAHDNGIKICKSNEYFQPNANNYIPYTISNAISSYNKRDKSTEDEQFNKAVRMATEILENIIEYVTNQFEDEELVRQIFNDQIDNNYIVFNKYYSYMDVIKEDQYSHITHLIFPEKDVWKAIGIKDNNTQKLKAPFPVEWGGLTDNELIEISNIEGSVFVHRGLWIAVNKTLDGIIKMVKSCY